MVIWKDEFIRDSEPRESWKICVFGMANVSSPLEEVVHRFEGELAEALGGCRPAVKPWVWDNFVLVKSTFEYSSVCFGVAVQHIPLVLRKCKPKFGVAIHDVMGTLYGEMDI